MSTIKLTTETYAAFLEAAIISAKNGIATFKADGIEFTAKYEACDDDIEVIFFGQDVYLTVDGKGIAEHPSFSRFGNAFARFVIRKIESIISQFLFAEKKTNKVSFIYNNTHIQIEKDLSNAYSTNKHYAASFYRVAQAHKKGYSMGGEDFEMLKALFEAGALGSTNELTPAV